MGILCNSSYRTILVIFALYSMCNIIEIVEGRFLWDLSSYCINYCSRVNGQMPPIGVCSCHRITSYHRRMSLNDLQTASKKDFQTMENFNQ
jgi:hypothetical protein